MVHWLARHAFTAKDPDSIPGWGTKILQATQHSQKRKRAKYHVGLSPHSQAEILPGEPSCDLRDSREVTVVLVELQEICPLEIAGNHCPGTGKVACRAVSPQRQSATKPSQGSSFQQKCENNWMSTCRNPQTPSQNTALIHVLSRAQLCATLWTAAHQAPLSTESSRQEYWSGLPCSPPGIFLTWGSNSHLLHLLL